MEFDVRSTYELSHANEAHAPGRLPILARLAENRNLWDQTQRKFETSSKITSSVIGVRFTAYGQNTSLPLLTFTFKAGSCVHVAGWLSCWDQRHWKIFRLVTSVLTRLWAGCLAKVAKSECLHCIRIWL